MQHQEYSHVDYDNIYNRTLSEIQQNLYELRKKSLRDPSHKTVMEYKEYRRKIREALDI